MEKNKELNWLDWARKLQAIGQNGLKHAETPFHQERYQKIIDIAFEIFSSKSGLEINEIKKIFSEEQGHATPKIDSRAVVQKGDKILFVQEKDDGLWSLPGGWVEVGERPKESIEKEVLEESGYVVEAKKLIGVYDKDREHKNPFSPFHVLSLFFLCELKEFTPRDVDNFEINRVGFFGISNMPPISTNRISIKHIKRAFQHLENSKLPTDFD